MCLDQCEVAPDRVFEDVDAPDQLRAEVRDFLTTRRGRITPGEAGLPV
jgi:hypothetical protein